MFDSNFFDDGIDSCSSCNRSDANKVVLIRAKQFSSIEINVAEVCVVGKKSYQSLRKIFQTISKRPFFRIRFLAKLDEKGITRITARELEPLLVELNDGNEVPAEVIDWVFSKADVNCDGKLNPLEIARAISAWYKGQHKAMRWRQNISC